jgi:glycosyltransferase involved in cell wall biosynthesis
MKGHCPPPGGLQFAMTHSAPGGLREIWNDISEELVARGHDVARFVLYPDGLRGDGKDAMAEGWHHLLSARPRGLLGQLRLMAALVMWIRRTRPAVIVTAMPFADVVTALAATLACTGTRVVVSHHSPMETHGKAINHLARLTSRLPAVLAVVCVSQAVASSFGRGGAARRKWRVIHNALPQRIERTIDAIRARDDLPKLAGRCIAVGRLSHQKNYPLLLRAFALMDTGTLDIVGAGEDETPLREMTASLGLAERVRFLGQQGREQTLQMAQQAEVFVQVSFFEGHSLALIEAARLGLPLVVSRVPVQLEAITAADDTLCGQAVGIDRPEDLARVLAGLLSSADERNAWSARARLLGLEASNAAMTDAYEQLLQQGRPTDRSRLGGVGEAHADNHVVRF